MQDVLCRLEEIKGQKIIDDKRAELYSSDRGKKVESQLYKKV